MPPTGRYTKNDKIWIWVFDHLPVQLENTSLIFHLKYMLTINISSFGGERFKDVEKYPQKHSSRMPDFH